MKQIFSWMCILIITPYFNILNSQVNSKKNLVYVDKKGVLRWTKDKSEASFFGVNYTVPFAYSYRAHKAIGVEIENAIQQDVYQMWRLGLDAFRVHVWDTEISDTAGNLLENDHLRLFDFLLSELEKRNIKIIITPIAFWGNGYPEKDETTPGFSRKFGKGGSTSKEEAIKAQENYLKQFFAHTNSYTKLTYVNDPNVIAVELNNEPSHSGSKESVTNYINRLATAVRSDGWTKPLYYNISQSPYYADAVAKAKIDGVSFQWYPTGLVANHEEKGNFLPNVDRYTIPYDTIPDYRNKSKMVYEFDAADVMQSCMYPAIARSFREAGFQWCAQFAYDPVALAYANTEYQTHYLNLFYTPSKAISLMIASKAFHRLPRLKSFGTYPADSLFDVFRVSYKNSLSEMNSASEFYYSNSTDSKPVDVSKLKHIAGVGNSPMVRYEGSGAYFLDKISDGVWRLEVMPDAVQIRDPFERASPQKEVTRIAWRMNKMQIRLPDLGLQFSILGATDSSVATSKNGVNADGFQGFYVGPGVYNLIEPNTQFDFTTVEKYFAPKPFSVNPYVSHRPFGEVTANRPFTISAMVVGIDSGDQVMLQINRLGGNFNQSKMITMKQLSPYSYAVDVPAEIVLPGMLNYRIIIHKSNKEYYVFPGNHKGDPFAWDIYINDMWETFVASENGRLTIYDPLRDKNIQVYPPFRRGFQTNYITGADGEWLILRLSATDLTAEPIFGFQYYFADNYKGRSSESFDKIVIRARTESDQPVTATVSLINRDGFAFSGLVTLTNSLQNIELPFSALKVDSELILPRPYPGFLPLWFKAPGSPEFKLTEMEKIQITVGSGIPATDTKKPYEFELESVWLEKIK